MNEEILKIAAEEKVKDLVSFIKDIEEDVSEGDRLILAIDFWCGEEEKVRGMKQFLIDSINRELYDRRREIDSEFIGNLNQLSDILNGAI